MLIRFCVVLLMILIAALFYGIGDENGYNRRETEEWERDEQTIEISSQ